MRNTKNMPTRRSCGVICCRFNTKTDKLEVMLIRKRNTFGYVDFVLGRYKKTDNRRLSCLLNHMTSEEKIDIASLDFDRMWFRIWLAHPPAGDRLHDRYIQCRNYFEQNFLDDGGRYLRWLLNSSGSVTTLWELPKGRKMFEEPDYNCAIRELEEETGIKSCDYLVLREPPITLSHCNSGVCYHNAYFIAILQNRRFQPRLNYNNQTQITEVIDVQWMDLQKISGIDDSRRIYSSVQKAFKILQKKYKIRRLALHGAIHEFPAKFL